MPLTEGRSRRSPLMWSQVCSKYYKLMFMLYFIQGTLFFVPPFHALTFEILPKVQHDPIVVSTQL